MDIIHPPVLHLKHEVSEAGFCLRIDGTYQLNPVDRASLCLRTPAPTYIYWAQMNTIRLNTKTLSSFRNKAQDDG
jgi:hypothetical protein